MVAALHVKVDYARVGGDAFPIRIRCILYYSD